MRGLIHIGVGAALCIAACAGSLAGTGQEPPTGRELQRVAASIQRTIERNYVLAGRSPEINAALATWLTEQDDASDRTRVALAAELTERLQAWSGDKHFLVFYPDPAALPPLPPPSATPPCWATITSLDAEAGSAGLLLEGFQKLPRRDEVGCAFTAAAPPVAVLDLRACTGGSRETVRAVLSQFVDAGVHYETDYDRRGSAGEFRTLNVDAPWTETRLYALVGASTASGCEAIAYHLKAMGRATIVGDVTTGAAHAVRTFDLAHGFRMFVPVLRPVSAFTGESWEGVGVVPDRARGEHDALALVLDELRR